MIKDFLKEKEHWQNLVGGEDSKNSLIWTFIGYYFFINKNYDKNNTNDSLQSDFKLNFYHDHINFSGFRSR